MTNIAIIPARGGSKRIKRKNIRKFVNKPMLQYAVEVAQKSGVFEHIVISSDDQEILKFGKSIGAETPFRRPEELSDDYTATVPVIKHSIRFTEALGWKFSYVCCLYPCTPFIEATDLISCLSLLKSSGVDYALPVLEFSSPIQRAFNRQKDGVIQSIYPEFELKRTQDLVKSYHDAGQFYWGRKSAWLSNPKLHSNSVGYIMPSWRVVDFDTEEDWTRGEMIYKALHHPHNKTEYKSIK